MPYNDHQNHLHKLCMNRNHGMHCMVRWAWANIKATRNSKQQRIAGNSQVAKLVAQMVSPFLQLSPCRSPFASDLASFASCKTSMWM
jgi:hypothetical protein